MVEQAFEEAADRLCVIGARGGSQGVPGKNIRMLHGKPLIAWSIERVLSSGLFSHVAISTDSSEIADVAREYGADVPFVRPKNLAKSDTGKFQVWQHALYACEDYYGRSFSAYADIDCTNPLLETTDYANAVALFDANPGVDAVMTVSKARRNPYFNLVEVDDDGFLRMSKSRGGAVLARQSAPAVYEHVAGIYLLRPDYIRRCNHLLDGRVLGCEVSEDKAFDIDSEFDFEIIQFLLGRRLQQ